MKAHGQHGSLHDIEILAGIEKNIPNEGRNSRSHHRRCYVASGRWIPVNEDTQAQTSANKIEVCVRSNCLKTIIHSGWYSIGS